MDLDFIKFPLNHCLIVFTCFCLKLGFWKVLMAYVPSSLWILDSHGLSIHLLFLACFWRFSLYVLLFIECPILLIWSVIGNLMKNDWSWILFGLFALDTYLSVSSVAGTFPVDLTWPCFHEFEIIADSSPLLFQQSYLNFRYAISYFGWYDFIIQT